MTSMYEKCCKNKTHFLLTYFLQCKVASKAMHTNCFRDMRPTFAACTSAWGGPLVACPPRDGPRGHDWGQLPEDDTLETAPADHYEFAMAPEHQTLDLPVQIANFFCMPMPSCTCCSSGSHCTWTLIATTWAWVGTVLKTASNRSTTCLLWALSWVVPQRGMWCAQGTEFVDIMTRLGLRAWYPVQQCCEPCWLYDEKTLGLFKTQWHSDGWVA